MSWPFPDVVKCGCGTDVRDTNEGWAEHKRVCDPVTEVPDAD